MTKRGNVPHWAREAKERAHRRGTVILQDAQTRVADPRQATPPPSAEVLEKRLKGWAQLGIAPESLPCVLKKGGKSYTITTLVDGLAIVAGIEYPVSSKFFKSP